MNRTPEHIENNAQKPEILDQTVLDDDRETMVEVDHVSMIFNMASEQLNSLKEYAISLARRELRFKEFRALDNVSLTVKRGDVYGIMGTNGSGKSTLLKIIAGVLDPSAGTCTVNGTIAPLIELGAGFDIELTARENIYLNGALLGYSKEFINEHFDEIVAFAEIGPFLDMPLKNYSSGMVARVAFAIATVIVPDILIVDEVLSVGDFMFQQKCERRIQTLIREYGVTVLIVSHNSEQVERLCNRAIWIEKSHTRMVGSASEVCRIYRILGGRSGSPESEKIILDLFEEMPSGGPRSYMDKISSSSQAGLSAQLFLQDKGKRETLVVAAGKEFTTNILAAEIAATENADMFELGDEGIDIQLEQTLSDCTYSKAIVIQGEQSISRDLAHQLETLLPDATFEYVKGDLPSWLSRTAFNLAKENGFLWSRTAAVSAPHNKTDLITIAPYLIENNIPLFFIDGAGKIPTEIMDELNTFDSLILMGGMVSFPESSLVDLDPKIETVRLFGDGPHDAYLKIREWMATKGDHGERRSFIASFTDVDALSSASLFTTRNNGNLLLYSDQSADSIAAIINKIRQGNLNAEEPCFIGIKNSMNKTTYALFSEAALASDNMKQPE